MQAYFDKLVCKCETCTPGTCRTYAYSLAFLAKHVADFEDLEGPEGVLAFLNEQPLSRRGGCLTALKVYLSRVLKKPELSDALNAPLMDVRVARDKRRRM